MGAERPGQGDAATERPSRQEALRQRLAQTVSLDASVGDAIPAVLGRPCREMEPYRGRTVGQVLLDPNADVAALATLKDYGKALARRGGSEADQAVSTAVYYGAIAAALAVHGRRITRYGFADLAEAFGKLLAEPWLSADLTGLYVAARDFCLARHRKDDAGSQRGPA